MTERTPAPYGSWSSPITSELVVRAAVGLGDVQVDSSTGAVWWSEGRPQEGGRVALVRRAADGTTSDILPAGWSARTRVHEYGGGAWWLHDGLVWFTNFADQRLYRLDPGADSEPLAVTPEPPIPCGWRYADGVVTPDSAWVVCVRESHAESDGTPLDEARNELVAIPADGSGEPTVIASGTDFVSSPRLDPSGTRLVWLVWDHPRMPWDGTELWVADLDLTAPTPHLVDPRFVAGGPDESIVQPHWTPDGRLLCVSDRSNWWNLHRVDDLNDPDALAPLATIDAEVSTPPWGFGQSRFALLDDGRIVMALTSGGVDRLAVLADGVLVDIANPYTSLSALRPVPGGVVCVAASPTAEPAVVQILVEGSNAAVTTVRPPRDLGIDPERISQPQAIEFESTQGRTAHALFYPPTNPDQVGLDGAQPPLLVMIHGGPTAAARPHLQLSTQYWTSRGIAVVDVNYGGSTGYGRTVRRELDGMWGVVDVDDCVAAATHLAERGLVDPDRLLIRGGSAGGFTTLAALAGRDVFAAGANYYGVADLAVLARDTHKFESRYLDGLVGPLPEAEAVYRDRSPIHHLDGFDRPLIVFQGLEDEIVPPNQSEAIVAALAAKGVAVAYVPFAGEQHGFRQAANIQRALDAELWFYGAMLGFDPADQIEPVEVING